MSGLRGYAEIWIDGLNTGFIVDQPGSHSIQRALSAGYHILSLYAPTTNEMSSIDFYARFFPDPALLDPDQLGPLLKTENGEAAP